MWTYEELKENVVLSSDLCFGSFVPLYSFGHKFVPAAGALDVDTAFLSHTSQQWDAHMTMRSEVEIAVPPKAVLKTNSIGNPVLSSRSEIEIPANNVLYICTSWELHV